MQVPPLFRCMLERISVTHFLLVSKVLREWKSGSAPLRDRIRIT